MSKNLTEWKKLLLVDENCYIYFYDRGKVSARLKAENLRRALDFYGLDNSSLVYINHLLCIKLKSNPMELPPIYMWEDFDSNGKEFYIEAVPQRNWLFEEAKKYYETVKIS
jgi:hypothetical protein